MHNKKIGHALWLATLVCIVSLPGCVARECTVSREVSKVGPDWSQTQLTQEYRGPQGQKVRDKQLIKEQIQCISKKTGKVMTVNSEQECFKRGGRVIDEIITEETTTTSTRK